MENLVPPTIAIEKVVSAKKIDFLVKNASDKDQTVRLFDQQSIDGKVNHKYVHIYSLTQFEQDLYKEFLKFLRNQKVNVIAVHLHFNGNAPAVFTANLVERVNGKLDVANSKLIQIRKSPYQQQSDLIGDDKLDNQIVLTKNTHLEFNMKANSIMGFAIVFDVLDYDATGN